MPYAITAADAESRIIAGRIVSWNAEAAPQQAALCSKKIQSPWLRTSS